MTDFTNDPLAWIDEELDAAGRQGLRRVRCRREGPQFPLIRVEGHEFVNFGSNDYLALASDPRLAVAVAEAVREEGWGAGASPLLCGYATAHQHLEDTLAEFEGVESAILFSSGFAANTGTVAALVGPGDAVYVDCRNHASLMDGCRLSRADVRVYPHNDWRALDKLLSRSRPTYRRLLIATDSLFSMDGDLAPLPELVELSRRHGGMLLVDEAHATGVFGPQGRGVAEHLGVEHGVDVRVGTLSKALGSVGGFVAGRRTLIDWLVNRARPYVFSTAVPAAVAGAANAAVRIVRSEPHRRSELLARSGWLRAELTRQGWDTGNSASQIIPVIVGLPERAMALASRLRQSGFYVPAIRPPSVPEGEACLRISVTYGHDERRLTELLEALAALRD